MKKIAVMNKAELKQDLALIMAQIATSRMAIKEIEGINQLNINAAQKEENEYLMQLYLNWIRGFEKKQRYIESQLQSLLKKENGS